MTYKNSTGGGHLASETKNTSEDLVTADLIKGADTFFLIKI